MAIDWSKEEVEQVEIPAVKILESLDYKYIDWETLREERNNNLREVFLIERLRKSLKKINPWINEENIEKAIDKLRKIQAVGLIETNQIAYDYLTNHISLKQDLGEGLKNQTVKFIDYDIDNINNNDFIVTRQYKVDGIKENIIPDIVVFINGIPIAVIECKAESKLNAMEEGITQLKRYCNTRNPEEQEGAVNLFNTNQVLISTFGGKAKFGTVGAGYEHFLEWKTIYPLNEDEVTINKPQDTLLIGIFRKENLLDLIQNFIVFESVDGKLIKKFARYQQFRAVNKTIDRLLTGKDSQDKSGVIWHTQGSGKSLTMVYLAIKLRRIEKLKNSTILIITDRVDLDKQITGTFQRAYGEEIQHAGSREETKELLKSEKSGVILSMIHKFSSEDEEEVFPVLSERENIIVMVDEAHRTQYKGLAVNMRTSLPNAVYLGFTGTPIAKDDRDTLKTFGGRREYIDSYPFNKAIKDGATVEILYEGRKPELMIEKSDLDAVFEEVFKDKTEKEKEEIKKRFVNNRAIAEAPERIRKICDDLVLHYMTKIKPNGFKAQVVTVSRRAAAIYVEILKEILKETGIEVDIVISGNPNDVPEIKKYIYDDKTKKDIIENFKKAGHPLSILVVQNMLLTGFDAPVEQVMYLDNSLKEHNLLQAIARVNRKYKHKKAGIIVDYYGVSKSLKEALEIFSDDDIEGALKPIEDILPRLDNSKRQAMSYFKEVDINNLEECILLFESELKRESFYSDYREFVKCYEILMPDPLTNKYKSDVKFLSKIYQAVLNRYRETMNLEGCGDKVRNIIAEYIEASGVKNIIKPVSILDKDFDKQYSELESSKSKASEIEQAINHTIGMKMEEDPVYYTGLLEKLKQIIDKNRENWDLLVKELEDFKEEIRNERQNIADTLGLTKIELAFYNVIEKILTEEEYIVAESESNYNGKNSNSILAKELVKATESESNNGWVGNEHKTKLLRRELTNNKIFKDMYQDRELRKRIINEIIEKLAKIHFKK